MSKQQRDKAIKIETFVHHPVKYFSLGTEAINEKAVVGHRCVRSQYPDFREDKSTSVWMSLKINAWID